MQSIRENDFECFASTGVNTLGTMLPNWGQPVSRDGRWCQQKALTLDFFISLGPVRFSEDALESFPGGTVWEILQNCYRVDTLILGINPLVDPVA